MTLPFAAIARARAKMIGGRLEGEQDRYQRDASEQARLFQQWATRKQLEDAQQNRDLQREWQNKTFTAGMDERAQARADQAAWREQQAADQKAYRESQMQENARLQRERLDAARESAAQQDATRRLIASMAATRQQQGPPPKPVPNAVATAFLSNQKQLKTIDDAISNIDANPGALGLKAYLPDAILNRVGGKTMKDGVEARAGVSDVGSLVIHDRTGAAMSASEWQRLKGFIPKDTDPADVARKKLLRMRQIIGEETQAMQDFYTPEQGYRGLPDAQPKPPAAKYSPHNPFAK